MNKIIGFLITKENITLNIDFFNVGLDKVVLKYSGYNIHLWGVGNIHDYKIGNKYSLSFPLNDSLLDRNVLIGFENGSITVENDWLGSIPIFYNVKEKTISTIANFCLEDKTISDEGLKNFCEFGYSVFEQTIFKDVKFMRYFSKLVVKGDEMGIEYGDDPALGLFFEKESKESKEADVVSLIQEYISNIESNLNGDIIIPTSGGHDSRFLNYLIKDKNKIRSFTYGVSKNQRKSVEVVYAKKISEIYKTKWAQVELKEFNKYIDKWFEIYGFSTHLHGMYHIEFYANIIRSCSFNDPTLLSGIIGDAWSELGKFKIINTYNDLINLGYTHGISLESKYLNIATYSDNIKKLFFESNAEYLKNDKLKAIFAMRTKIILISYLTQIPEYFGLPVWTPFLNFEIVRATLNIKNDRRKDRIWQKDFFRKAGLNLEEMNLRSNRSNSLDYEIAKNTYFEMIDISLMKKYIKEDELVAINSKLKKFSVFDKFKNKFLLVPKIGWALKRLGFENVNLKYLCEYYIIKDIEKSIKYES